MAKSTVTVGCKLPNGLEIEVGGKSFVLKGLNSANIINGHGITEVPADVWAKWIADNKEFTPVKAGLIFAHEDSGKTRAEAREKIDNKSGLEGINPKKPGEGVKPANDKDDDEEEAA